MVVCSLVLSVEGGDTHTIWHGAPLTGEGGFPAMLLALIVGSLTTLFYFWVEGYSSRINSLTAFSTIGNPEVWTRARMFPMADNTGIETIWLRPMVILTYLLNSSYRFASPEERVLLNRLDHASFRDGLKR